MIFISKYSLERKKNTNDFYLRSKEENPACPCCSGKMKIIGNRPRKVIRQDGSFFHLIIRRYQCENCHRVHHELPDFLVPYKRYTTDAIEIILKGTECNSYGEQSGADFSCEYSTAWRLRTWFQWLIALLNSLEVYNSLIRMTFNIHTLSVSVFVDSPPGWLKKLIKLLYLNKLYP